MSYFPQSGYSKNKTEVKLDLSNYATKPSLKNATVLDASQYAKKDDLTNLKVEVDILDTVKLEKALNSLSNLKSKVHELDVDNFALMIKSLMIKSKKTDYKAKIKDIEGR